jgi:predicted nucleotidyltransferase
LGIDYFLVGALARQVWYEKVGLHFRTTKDVDYAALIGNHEEYQAVKRYLMEKEGYVETRENPFVLITPDGIQVDILPFGEIESDGSVEIKGTGMTGIRVDGMKEVYALGTEEVELDTLVEFLQPE